MGSMTPLVRAGRLAAAALAGTALAGAAAAAPPADARDARIDALEAQVRALSRLVDQMRRERAGGPSMPAPAPASAAAGAQPQPPVGATFAPGGAASGTALAASGPGDGGPPATSPDQPRAVTSGGPGPNQGGATILAGRPSIQSGDGRFVANLHAVMQFDTAYYSQRRAGPIATDLRRGGAAGDTAHARDLNSGTNFRRARIGIDGRVFGDFDYNVLLDFGGSGTEDAAHIQELWLQYTGLQPFRFRVGAYPPPIGLEDQNSTNGMPLLERPAISDIARSIAGGDYREGATLTASRPRWFAAVSLTTRTVGVANSSASGAAQSFDQAFGGILRVAALPLVGDAWLVHVGAHGSRVFQVADQAGPTNAGEINATRFAVQLRERPELRVDGTRLIDTGSINARHVTEGGLELAGQYGPFYAQGEYERITIQRRDSPLADPHFHGYYVEGGFMLTGERRKYNTGTFAFDGPPVDHPFDLGHGTIGAVELVGRYSLVDLNYRQGAAGRPTPADGVRGGEQRIVAAGVNWYLNPVVRFMLDYQHVTIDRLSPSATAYLTPVGASIGQHYDTVAVRSQFAF